MRTLDQITQAIRLGCKHTKEEAAYAVVAYDVLMHQLSVDQDPVRLAEYFKAAERSPIEYIGWVNDPENPDAVDWYRAMIHIGEKTDESD